VRSGHEVRVVCSRGTYVDGRGKAPLRETRGGVEIRRVRASGFGRGSAPGRLLDYASFHLGAGLRVLFDRWADVVVTLTTPPLLSAWGGLARRLRGRRHVSFVMDLHPDAEFELGMLRRGSLLGRVLEAVNAWSLRSSDQCVVLGPYQGRRLLGKRVRRDRIREIPIWSDGEEIQPIPHAENPLREESGWGSRLVCLYSGNAGLVHRFEELLEAIEIVGERRPEVLFAFVGRGPRLAEVRAHVAERGLQNVEVRDYVPRERLGQSLAAADLHFVSLRSEQTGVAVPGKLYGCLASGRPVLFVGDRCCESADAVRSSGGGLTFQPGQGRELAEALLELADDAELRDEMGRRGRAYFLAYHDRIRSCERWRHLLEELCGVPQRVRSSTPARPVEAVRAALPREEREATEPVASVARPAESTGETTAREAA